MGNRHLCRPDGRWLAFGPALYGSIAGVAAACASGARAVAPVVAAGAYVLFQGYKPLLWLMVAGALLAAMSAQLASRRLADIGSPDASAT